MVSEFHVEVRRLRDAVVVAVTGEIDLFTTPEFKAAVATATSLDADTVLVDITRATFLDSSSLGVLIGAHRRLARRGRRFAIACDQQPILKVLRVTWLDGVFDIVESIPEALGSRVAG